MQGLGDSGSHKGPDDSGDMGTGVVLPQHNPWAMVLCERHDMVVEHLVCESSVQYNQLSHVVDVDTSLDHDGSATARSTLDKEIVSVDSIRRPSYVDNLNMSHWLVLKRRGDLPRQGEQCGDDV